MKYLFWIFVLLIFQTSPSNAQSRKAKKGMVEHIFVFDGVLYEQYNLVDYRPNSLSASSTLAHPNNRYQVGNLLDEDLGTAWVEGKKGDGIGTILSFQFPQGSPPDLIEFVPGYARSEGTWDNNYRILAFEIRLKSGPETESPNEIIDSFLLEIPTEEGKVKKDFYTLPLHALYLQNMAYEDFEFIELEIKNVDGSGAKYQDTCISELRFKRRATLVKTLDLEAYQRIKNDN